MAYGDEFYGEIEALDEWIDDGTSVFYKTNDLARLWARVGKLGEELGEVVSALIGMTGQNPRKGFYATEADLLKELADVVVTGMCAIQSITKSTSATQDVVDSRVHTLIHRMEEVQANGK